MDRAVSPGLKTVFLLHFLVSFALGFLYLALPSRFGEMVGWPPAQPFDHQVIGTVFIAFGVASALAWRLSRWERVELYVRFLAVWKCLAALLLLWGLVARDLPPLGWAYLALVGGFAVAFLASLRRHGA